MGRFGRHTVPAEVRDSISLDKGERVLVATRIPDGWIAATTRAVWLPDHGGMTRVGWEAVDNVTWDDDAEVLQVVQTTDLGGRPRRWDLHLDQERELLLVIKERVRATVLTSRRVSVYGEQGITVVARRPPGTDDVTWAVSVDAGVDVSDPRVRSVVDETLREVRGDLGR